MDVTTVTALRAGAGEGFASRPPPLPFRPIGRWEMLSLVRGLRQELCLSRGDLEALQALLSFLPCKDRQTGKEMPVSPGMLLVVYASNESILTRTNGMSERALRDHVARLVRAGLVLRKESANGKRFPLRRGGRLVDAFGLDLSPAFRSVPALMDLDRGQREARETARNLRSDILARRRRLIDMAARLTRDALDWLRDLFRLLRRRLDPIELADVSARLSDLEARCLREQDVPADQDDVSPSLLAKEHARAAQQTAAQNAAAPLTVRVADERSSDILHEASRSRSVAVAPFAMDAPHECLDRRSCQPPPPEPAASDGEICRHIESNQTRVKEKACGRKEPGMRDLWHECRAIAEYFPDPPASPRECATVLGRIAGFLTIPERLVLEAMRYLGLAETARKLNYLVANAERVANPGGYLRQIIHPGPSSRASGFSRSFGSGGRF